MQSSRDWLGTVKALHDSGLSDSEIAKSMGIKTTQLRARRTIAINEKRQADAAFAMRLKDKGTSNMEIGRRLGVPESTVRSLLNPALKERMDVLNSTVNILKEHVGDSGLLDVGEGTERHLGISDTKLKAAVAQLREEGYKTVNVKVPQAGAPGNFTSVKVLAPPDMPYSEIYKRQSEIKTVAAFSNDGGKTYDRILPPVNVDSKRIEVKWAEEGGAQKDGVIELRRNVEDLSLGGKNYAQVRVAVDGTHYLKGMAVYADDLPAGVDMRFNTSKLKSESKTGNKLEAMKPQDADPGNPFGSVITQRMYTASDGTRKLSPLNRVYEEGEWDTWSKKLSSQFLSKQQPSLIQKQLDLSLAIKKSEFDEIKSLTNPTIKKKLLTSFSDGCDSSSVHLKAAGLPQQRTHVILPINTLKDNEIYAPNYDDGDRVVLIRHPHGGIFEIPELTVNNNNALGKKILKRADDAVGINSKVAERLSGADFDGDTVLVIPNRNGLVKTRPPLENLKGFDPKRAYPYYDGMKVMTPRGKQKAMGDISNLITDMTIRGAGWDEIGRAVRHSMVVIDAEKHKLNYKQSALDNGISGLKTKYQNGPKSGASTLISKAKSQAPVPRFKPRPAAEGGPIDPVTGKKVFVPTGDSYIGKNGKLITPMVKSTKMAETDNAFTLSSGTRKEAIYATYANQLKAMANEARKESLMANPTLYSPSDNKVYSKEVASLKDKLDLAIRHKPLERQAQLIADATIKAKLAAHPEADADDIKKIKGMALADARARTGFKPIIEILPKEWEAIQAGAITNNMLENIIANTDIDVLKTMAMPRAVAGVSAAKQARAQSMLDAGYTQWDVADALGISINSVKSIRNPTN